MRNTVLWWHEVLKRHVYFLVDKSRSSVKFQGLQTNAIVDVIHVKMPSGPLLLMFLFQEISVSSLKN